MSKIFDAKKYKEVEIFYSDIDKNMSKNYNSDISLIINNADVAQSLQSLLMTEKGSVPFRPDFGCDLSTILFENMSLLQADRLRTRIINTVKTFEPRVLINDVNVIPEYASNLYSVYIYYKVIYNTTQVYKLYIPLQSISNE